MTTPLKTCANCGHAQNEGDFCEACGTRLPEQASSVPTRADAAPGAGAGYAPPPPPPPPPATGYAPPAAYQAPPRGDGFWARLFDLSFEEFITPSIIKVLFLIAIVVIGLSVLGAIVMGFVSSGALGIVILVAALVAGFIYLLFARVFLEMVVVFFRIRDDTEELVRRKR
jgi:hypothetical protein